MPELRTNIELTVRDTRTITCPAAADSADTEQLGKALVDAGQNGFGITSVVPIQRDEGNQRDPHIVTYGMKLVLTK